MFLPQTLHSQWYRDDIFWVAIRSVEGMGQWNAGAIEDETNREAYRAVIKECLDIMRSSYSLDHAISGLQEFKELLVDRQAPRRSPFPEKWSIIDIAAHWDLAARHALELTTSIRNRYLPNK